jgi:hypothetical protein
MKLILKTGIAFKTWHESAKWVLHCIVMLCDSAKSIFLLLFFSHFPSSNFNYNYSVTWNQLTFPLKLYNLLSFFNQLELHFSIYFCTHSLTIYIYALLANSQKHRNLMRMRKIKKRKEEKSLSSKTWNCRRCDTMDDDDGKLRNLRSCFIVVVVYSFGSCNFFTVFLMSC